MNNAINIEKYYQFLVIASKLNQAGIIPLLMGSLGLALITGVDWNPSDIDIHVPGDPRGWEAPDEERIYNWDKIQTIMFELGYQLTDLHEHEFEKDGLHVEFGVIDTLPAFAGVDLIDIQVMEYQGIKFSVLDCSQYLKVYLASSKDGYRNNQNNNKDFKKIEYLKSISVQCDEEEMEKGELEATFRLATPDDALNLAEIHMRSWEVAYKDIMPMDFIHQKNATRVALYNRVITSYNTNTYLIEYKGKPAGLMNVDIPKDDDINELYYEVYGLYLHPKYFRRGLGTQAIEFAGNLALNLGKLFLTVWVLKDNLNSIRFYEKCGFVADGMVKDVEYGKRLQCIRMKKVLCEEVKTT